MNADDWARLKVWFGEALDAPERVPELLGEAERASPKLAAELRALLKEHDAPSFDTVAAAPRIPKAIEAQPLDGPAGGEVGPYRVLRELGRGGAGVVFLAERKDDEFHRPVALKVLRYVAWDRRTRELLTDERRVLSQLQHANIAALLDWSTADDDAPWLAMEFVDGEPIDEYCHSRTLSVPQTLDVFEQVCEAVQYAHRRLVVHRDLKPGNILVSRAGVVKLLDFGISKRVEDATITNVEDRRFTPAYASPEQILGETITAATDVYSLGLILYELISGTVPHASGSVDDLVRRTQDRSITAPSGRAVLPSITPRAIHNDLDRIVLHALERDPERRYPSVEQLLADIRRFRNGFPIAARRPSPVYRAQKFAQRNKLPVALGALAVVALVGGTGVAIAKARDARREQQVAERRFEDVRNLAHWVIFDAHDAIRRIPGTVAVRRDLLTKAVEYLDQLHAEHGADDALLKEIAQAYIRVGYSQGGLAGTNLGNTAASRKNYQAALSILDPLWARHPDDQWIGAVRFAAVYNLAIMANDPVAGAALASRYVPDVDAWGKRTEGGPPMQAAGLVHLAYGRTLRASGEYERALEQFDIAIAAHQRGLPFSKTDNTPRPMFGTWVDRSQNYFDTGLVLYARTETLLSMGKSSEAVTSAEEARAMFAKSQKEGLGGPSDLRMFARVHGLIANTLLALRQPAQLAAAQAAAQIEMKAALLNVADGNATSMRDLGEAHRHMGNILVARGDVRGGLTQLQQSADILGMLVKSDSVFLMNRYLLAETLTDHAAALASVGRRPAADSVYRNSVALLQRGLVEAPGWVDLRRELDRANAGLAKSASAPRRYPP